MEEQRRLARVIVDGIRSSILAMIQNSVHPEEVDPWDEEDNGAAWLDNELGIASACQKSLPDWSQCQTVQQVQDLLETLDVESLKFIWFVVNPESAGSDRMISLSPQEIMNRWCHWKDSQGMP